MLFLTCNLEHVLQCTQSYLQGRKRQVILIAMSIVQLGLLYRSLLEFLDIHLYIWGWTKIISFGVLSHCHRAGVTFRNSTSYEKD